MSHTKDFIPHFKIQRYMKLNNLEEFHLLFVDAEEQERFHSPDAVFGRFLYYEELETDLIEKSIQCRLILFEDLEKEQVEDLLGEIFFRLGLEEIASATDIFFASRDQSFSLFREIGEDLEDEDEDEDEALFTRSRKELDAERLELPKNEDKESSESGVKRKHGHSSKTSS